MFGLKPSGFKRKTYKDIKESMEARAIELFGESVNLAERSALGMFIRLFAWSLGIAWQLAEKVYFSGFVGTAEGTSLDYLAKSIGISRNPASKASGVVTFEGDEDTVIPAGFQVATDDGIVFVTTENVTIDSSGEVDANIESDLFGDFNNVPMGAITAIVNPLAGVDSVTNSDATQDGADVESDVAFRARYKASVEKTGSSTSASIQATILDIDGVFDAFVRENETNVTVNDIPPNSVAPIVAGGDNTDIALAILGTKAGGIQSFGDVVETVEDSRGVEFDIGFSRPTEIVISVEATTFVTDASFPEDGEEQIENAIQDYIQSLRIGQDVIYTKIVSLFHAVGGVIDLDVEVNGVTANISISDEEISVFDEVVFPT